MTRNVGSTGSRLKIIPRFVQILRDLAVLISAIFWILVNPPKWKKLWNIRDIFLEISRSGFIPSFHWSQDGEDIYFKEFLPPQGFYVDVGAHHPFRFSVTKCLYDMGWNGVNIDVTEAIRGDFLTHRPRDSNIFTLVGRAGNVLFTRFEESALNTLDPIRAAELVAQGWKSLSSEEMTTAPLTEVLSLVDAPRKIDLLSVDVEGADLEVLETMDFKKYDVVRVLVEIDCPAWALADHPVSRFLEEAGFRAELVWPRSALFGKYS